MLKYKISLTYGFFLKDRFYKYSVISMPPQITPFQIEFWSKVSRSCKRDIVAVTYTAWKFDCGRSIFPVCSLATQSQTYHRYLVTFDVSITLEVCPSKSYSVHLNHSYGKITGCIQEFASNLIWCPIYLILFLFLLFSREIFKNKKKINNNILLVILISEI